MNIHQVSVSYVQEQDRLLIRINGRDGNGELRAWMTRRLALALLPVLDKSAANQMQQIAGPAAPANTLDEQRGQLLTAFEKEASLRSGDFQTPYKDREDLPDSQVLGPGVLLLTEVQVTLMGNGQLRLQMFEKLPGQEAVRNFQIMMDAPLSNGLLHLLHKSLVASQWLEVPFMPAAGQPEAPPDTEAAELAAELAKPKYLN